MWAEIDVSDPGYGYVIFRRLDGRYDDPREMSEHHGEFAGRKLGDRIQFERDGVTERPDRMKGAAQSCSTW